MKLTDVIDQFLMDCSNRGRAEGTLINYRRWLGLLARWLEPLGVTELEAVTLPVMRQFLHFLLTSDSNKRFPDAVQKGKLAASTVSAYVAAIKAFFQWCVPRDAQRV